MAAHKCKCNVWMSLLAAALFAIAVYLMVNGFVNQFNSNSDLLTILGWYFVGFIVLMIAKICKHQSHTNCKIHQTR